MGKKKLTPKQAAFVAEYLIDLNASAAARRAGYSEKTAGAIGDKLLKKAEIQESLSAAMKARANRTEITQDRVLQELGRIGFSDLRCYFHDDGSLKPIHELDDDAAAALSGVKVVTTSVGEDVLYVKEIKLWDKKGGLELIGKHLKMFTEKVEVDVSDSLRDILTGRLNKALEKSRG